MIVIVHVDHVEHCLNVQRTWLSAETLQTLWPAPYVCMIPLNRDKNGATNIGTNFLQLFKNQPPIRSMTDEDVAFHRASLCLECNDD